MMTDHHLAQFNFARLRYLPMDEENTSLRDGSAVLNRMAERAPGFIWSYKTSGPNGTSVPPILNDPQISLNLSVWKSLSAVENFVFNTLHKTYLQRKNQWFTQNDTPAMVLWWVPIDHEPNVDEALDRLAILKSDGPSERAFDWAYAQATYA